MGYAKGVFCVEISLSILKLIIKLLNNIFLSFFWPKVLDTAEEFTVTLDFGGWETHTRGIGSKLMLKMGYEYGKGRCGLSCQINNIVWSLYTLWIEKNGIILLHFTTWLCFVRIGKNAGRTSRTRNGRSLTKR